MRPRDRTKHDAPSERSIAKHFLSSLVLLTTAYLFRPPEGKTCVSLDPRHCRSNSPSVSLSLAMIATALNF